MALIPWRKPSSLFSTPTLSPMFSLQRDINRMFDDFLGNGGSLLTQEGFWTPFPDLDINETDKQIHLSAEIPGMTDKDIKVNLAEDGETLTIEGEKRTTEETKKEGMYCQERRYGRFRRVVSLPAVVDGGRVEATCKDGVLKVDMHKLPERQQRVKQIPVKSA